MTLSPTLSLFSPAKINLFLHITGKREDGYHNLQTVFRLLNWGDTLDFNITQKTLDITIPISQSNLPIELDCSQEITDNILDNLIIKAAIALVDWINKNHNPTTTYPSTTLPVIAVKLHKVLPTGAGLGGGSSNAATTLCALNKLWGLNLDKQTLIDIGMSIGADVPIFLFAKDAIAEGIGEKLTPISLPKQHYLVLNPNVHATTKELFAHPDLQRDCTPLGIDNIRRQQKHFLNTKTSLFHNVFEPVVTQLVPEVHTALIYLRSLEHITQSTARMTGTGSSVFLPIPSHKVTTIQNHIDNIDFPPCHAILTDSYKALPSAL